jgi:Putative zinc ribbon domain
MPLSRDSEGGGTNADGTRSQEFCSHCYANGTFTEPDLTAEQMVIKVRGKMREMKIPGFLAGFMVKGIPRLRRWAGGADAR